MTFCLTNCWTMATKCRKRCSGSNTATPLPRLKVFAVASVFYSFCFGLVMIFPFIPFMVHDFFPDLSTEELGQKVGFLGTSYFVGVLFGSIAWGWVADVWGRRPVLLLGSIGAALSQLLFGFSQNYVWALSARLVWGLLSGGNLGVSKSYLSEVCDGSNQTKGFSLAGSFAGIGKIAGSVAGGFLAQPAIKYSTFQHPFFCKFPYILPMSVSVVFELFTFVYLFLFLEESLPKIVKGNHSLSPESGGIQNDGDSISDADTDMEMISLTSESESESANQITAESDMDSQSDAFVNSDSELLLNGDVHIHKHHHGDRLKRAMEYMNPITIVSTTITTQKEQCILCFWCCQGQRKNSFQNFWSQNFGKIIVKKLIWIVTVLMDRAVILSVLMYAILGFVELCVIETFPLLMVTSHKNGGYNMDDNEIGMIIMIEGVLQLIYQQFLFVKVHNLLKNRHTFRVGLLMMASILLLPWSTSITGPISSTSSPAIANSTSTWDTANDTSTWGDSDFMSSGSGADGNVTQLDYCGQEKVLTSFNENSIRRIPIVVWIVILTIFVFFFIGGISSYLSVFMMINNSAVAETRGTINGVGQALVAIGRGAGPTIAGLSFAWSERNGRGWPLNYHFVYVFSTITLMMLLCLSLFLPKSVESKRTSSNTNS